MITKRSNHMPMLTKIEITNSAVMLVRIFLNQSSRGSNALQMIIVDVALQNDPNARYQHAEVQVAARVVPPLLVGAKTPDRGGGVELLAQPRREVAHGGDVGNQPHDEEDGRDGEVRPDRELVPDERRLEVGPEAALVGI